MIEESKYFSDMMKKHSNKELVMTKKDNEDFRNLSKCWFCDNDYLDDVKLRDHCLPTGNIQAQHIEIVISKLN